MVPLPSAAPPWIDRRAVLGLVHLHAQRAQAGRHRGQAVRFLDPQLGRATHHGVALRGGRGDEQRRELIDRS